MVSGVSVYIAAVQTAIGIERHSTSKRSSTSHTQNPSHTRESLPVRLSPPLPSLSSQRASVGPQQGHRALRSGKDDVSGAPGRCQTWHSGTAFPSHACSRCVRTLPTLPRGQLSARQQTAVPQHGLSAPPRGARQSGRLARCPQHAAGGHPQGGHVQAGAHHCDAAGDERR